MKKGKERSNLSKKIFKAASKILHPRDDTWNYWTYFWNYKGKITRPEHISEKLKNLNNKATTHIFTDGSSLDQNKAGWGIVVTRFMPNDEEDYYGIIITDKKDIDYLGARKKTNNTAELTAIGKALQYIAEVNR